jgi:hypothetical protein
MPKVTINDSQGLVQSSGSGVQITSDVTVSGAATFAGSVSGVTATAIVNELDDAALSSPETYSMADNVRVIRYNSAPSGNWTIAALTNSGLSTSQATTLKVVFPAPAADRTITLTGITVDGIAATQVNPGSLKAKKDGKCNGIALDVVKNSAGNFYVYGSALANGE